MRNQRPLLIIAAVLAGLLLLGVVAAGAGVYLYSQASATADRARLREIDDQIVTTLDAQMRREREINKAAKGKDVGEAYWQDAEWRELSERVGRLEAEADEIRRRR